MVSDTLKPYKIITDFATGRDVPNIGAEENRQVIERFLIEQKGYLKEDIQVDADIELTVAGELYRSQLDLVISADGGKTRFMAIRCAAGSLGSREREIVAAARLLDDYQIPLSVASDGKTAIVLDTVSGKKIGAGMDAIPSKKEALEKLKNLELQPLPNERLDREKLIFRTYDSQNVNVQRSI
jgi:Type I restriction enzyme R protein N terminus (HSDR_N)